MLRNTCLIRGTSISTIGRSDAYSLVDRERAQRALPADHGHHLLEDGVEVGRLGHEVALAAELQQIAHDVAGPRGLLLDEAELLAHGILGGQPLGDERREAEHGRERVVDLVGDVGGQLADGGQLGGLHELGLRLLELGHLLLDALVEPGVFDGQRALERDALGQPQLVGREAMRLRCSTATEKPPISSSFQKIGWMSIDRCGTDRASRHVLKRGSLWLSSAQSGPPSPVGLP